MLSLTQQSFQDSLPPFHSAFLHPINRWRILLYLREKDLLHSSIFAISIECLGDSISTGFDDGSCRPQGSATRAQMAAIIARLDRMGRQ